MPKFVSPEELTQAEFRALRDFFHNRLAEQELSEAAQGLTQSGEERLRLIREGTAEERNAKAQAWLKVARVAVELGRLQEPEAFLFRVMAIEHLHNDRLLCGEYPQELADVKARIAGIRNEFGLTDLEYWPLGQGPAEYQSASEEYDRICDRLFACALREFGLADEARLLEEQPEEFHRRRELGRRARFEGLSDVERLTMMQKQFVGEASKSAYAGAFQAAAAMIGAAMEAALLARCLQRLDEARVAYDQLQLSGRQRSNDPRDWKFHHLCKVADRAGWLPTFDLGGHHLAGDSLIDLLRDLRNTIHPAKLLRDIRSNERRGERVVRSQYTDARAAYELLQRHLAEH
jgi:hypothetical protein